MSIAIRHKSLTPSIFPSSTTGFVPAAPVARTHVEAPERAASFREAPESRSGRRAEAPDAGEGRDSSFDHDFTQGRSQS